MAENAQDRYLASGIIGDMRGGKRVVYVGLSVEGRALFDELGRTLQADEVKRMSRANGSDYIDHTSGGRFSFVSTGRNSLRGYQADVVVTTRKFLDSLSMDRRADFVAHVALARGELVAV